MSKKLVLVATALLSAFAFAACNDTTTNGNYNSNSNANSGSITRNEPTATATPTPGYTEEQGRQERERAKASKETIGQSLDDAWVHAKVVAKLISDTKTPERNINVDVVEGTVTLRGQVDTADAKTEAEQDTKDTDGVKKVVNELKVVPAKSASSNKSNSNKSVGNSNKPGKEGKTPE
jgi:osmotically-inducible protein OsmY